MNGACDIKPWESSNVDTQGMLRCPRSFCRLSYDARLLDVGKGGGGGGGENELV